MPTNFPTSVDNFTNPTANDSLNLPSHSTQHSNANDAIEAVEAYLLTGAGKSGLVHLNTTAFSGSSAYNFNTIFNATYDDYLVILSGVASASGTPDITVQLTIGGTPTAGTGYYYGVNAVSYAGTGSVIASNGGANWYCGNVAPDRRDIELRISEPFLAVTKSYQIKNAAFSSQIHGGGLLTTATSHDGFRLTSSSGNVSGTMRVYGYRNS